MSQPWEGTDVTTAPNSRTGSITAPQQNTHMLGTHPLTDRLAEAPPQLESLVYSKPSPSTGVLYTAPEGHSLVCHCMALRCSQAHHTEGSAWFQGLQFGLDSSWKLKLLLPPLVDTVGRARSRLVSGLMVLLEVGEAHFVLQLGTKEGERINTLSWSLCFPIRSVWVYTVEPGQDTWYGEGEDFFASSLRIHLGLCVSYQALSRRAP